MASPQKENGYTPIANEILDKLAKMPLNGSQRRIIDSVWRYTYGFSRKEHDLSEGFIANYTNLSLRQVKRELLTLIGKRMIIVVSEASRIKSRVLIFNKNYDEWVVTNQSPGDKQTTTGGGEQTPTPGDKQTTTLKIKKEQNNNAETYGCNRLPDLELINEGGGLQTTQENNIDLKTNIKTKSKKQRDFHGLFKGQASPWSYIFGRLIFRYFLHSCKYFLDWLGLIFFHSLLPPSLSLFRGCIPLFVPDTSPYGK